MVNTVKALTALKHSCDALIDNGDRAQEVTFHTTGNTNLVAFSRHHNEQQCLVLLNLGTGAVNTTVSGLEAGTWKRAIDSEHIADGMTAVPVTFSTTQSFSIPAGGYQVYVKGESQTTLLGDINGDGEVNISDINMLISIILNSSSSSPIQPGTDINGDGEVNISDVTRLIDIVLNMP